MPSIGTIAIEDNRIKIECAAHVAIKLQRVFAGIHREGPGRFSLTAKSELAYELEWFRQRYPMEIDAAAAERFEALVQRYRDRMAAIAEIDVEGYVPPEFELALPPREYQRIAAALAVKSGRLLIADQLGLGKTITGICTLVAPGALPALVVTMNHLTRQWESELKRFAPKLRVHRINKGTPYPFTDVRVEKGADGKRRIVRGPVMPDVLITSYTKLAGWQDHLSGKIKTVVFDEMQELRVHDTKKREAAVNICEGSTMRVGLTATPVYNYGDEIHSIVSLLDPDALGDRLEFLREWCSGYKQAVTDPRALGIYLRESGLMIRRERRDVGRELPDLTIVRHIVETDAEQFAKATSGIAELARRVIERIGTPLEQMHTAGELDWRLRQATGIAKAPAVIEFVRLLLESEQRVLLFGWHLHVYEIWKAALKTACIPFAMFTGEDSEPQKAKSIAAFKSGAARVLIMSLRAGAGIDGLQAVCRTVVNGELDWSPKVHEQGGGRVHRDGQAEPVTIYYCVAEDGSDPVIEDVLGIKESQSSGIMRPYDDEPLPIPSEAESVNRIKKLAEDVLRKKR